MPNLPLPSKGQTLLAVSAIAQILGPWAADYNHTHIFNAAWPPHAKFHNGQTMSMGACLGLLSLYYTFRFRYCSPSTLSSTPAAEAAVRKKDSLRTAALVGSLYWVTGLSAVLYPGSLAIDPEFGTGFPQFWLFVGMSMASWGGWWMETKRVDAEAKEMEGKRA